MILYPAIDLKDGACVRLKLGDMNEATVYNADPAAQAGDFARLGFPWLHVVDLNGAFEGRSVNGSAVEAILAAVAPDMKVQLGGGIRDMATIETWLAKGIRRVILGTIADGRVELEVIHRFPSSNGMVDGHFRWDLPGIFAQISDGLALVGKRGVAVDSIGVDT